MKDSIPKIQIERVVSNSQGSPIEARITIGVVLSCPVCSLQQEVSCSDYSSAAVGWSQDDKFFPWCLPDMALHLPWMIDRIVEENRRCEGCGTGGGLTPADGEAIKQNLLQRMTQLKFIRLLTELGFRVDNNSFSFVGATAATVSV